MSKPPIAYVYSTGVYGHQMYRIFITDLEMDMRFSGLRGAEFSSYSAAQALANTIKNFAKQQKAKKRKVK